MTRPLLALLGLCLLLAVAAVPALAGPAATGQAAATKTVSVRDNFFGPKFVKIRRGSRIRWVWRGDNAHDVRSGRWGSRIKAGGSFTRRFRSRGRFTVYCSIHRSLGMRMTVRVVR